MLPAICWRTQEHGQNASQKYSRFRDSMPKRKNALEFTTNLAFRGREGSRIPGNLPHGTLHGRLNQFPLP